MDQKLSPRSKMIEGVIMAFVAVVFVIILGMGLYYLQIKLFAPEDWLFSEMHSRSLLALLAVIPIILLFELTDMFMFHNEKLGFFKTKLGKLIFVLCTVLWLGILYTIMSNVSFVTRDSIEVHKPAHPGAVSYSYEDVKLIECGFKGRDAGFYYMITLNQGDKEEKVMFVSPDPNPDYYNNQEESYYLNELIDFDQSLVDMGIRKIYHNEKEDKVRLDESLKEKVMSIIHNGLN